MRLVTINLLAVLLLSTACDTVQRENQSKAADRTALWVNAVRGEPVSFDGLLDELQSARVIYLGEFHSISRHHQLQNAILQGLARRGARLAVGMEQFETSAQPALDAFNTGQSDVNRLVAESGWAERWRGHTNYLPVLATAHEHRIPVIALNARAETIRAVARQGLNGITPEQRAELPAEIVTDDPAYERLATRLLGVHMAFDPKRLHTIFEAQVARDETMAARLAEFLESPAGKDRIAVVICGRGHCEFGLGMPDRVSRRMPGIVQRIVLFSQSGDLHLSAAEREQAREVEVTHDFYREVGRLPADFFHVISSERESD